MAFYPKNESQELNVLLAQVNTILGANYFAIRIDKETCPINTSGGRRWQYYLYKTRLGVQDLGSHYDYLVTKDNDGMFLNEMRLWLSGVIDGLRAYKEKILILIN